MSRKNFGAKTYLYPQPVMIIATYDENGRANAMNAAWGGIAGPKEIIIDLGQHKTTDNLAVTKAFTVSIGDKEHTTACDFVGMTSAKNCGNKLEKAGFTVTKSEFVNAPVIKLGDMSAGINTTISTDFSKELLIKNLNIKSKYINPLFILIFDSLFSMLPSMFFTILKFKWGKNGKGRR